MPESQVTVPNRTPPTWLNQLMVGLLRTPGLNRLVGRSVALLSFTGTRSGRRYTIPVTYDRSGDTVVILTKAERRWWRNLVEGAPVELRLAGQRVGGRAFATQGDEAELDTLIDFLGDRPIDARAYGLSLHGGRVDPAQARQLLDLIVVIRITLTPPPA